jgi:hypothetical protein
MHLTFSSTIIPYGGEVILLGFRAESKLLQRSARSHSAVTYQCLLLQGFVLNLYDGFTGVITHPYRDTRKDGVAGLGKGIGRGAGGLVLKTMAAVFGLPAYTLKGVEKQFEKRRDRNLQAKILNVRLKQGMDAFRRATEEERQEILRRWKELGVR